MASMRHALSNVAANSRRTNSPLPMILLGLALIVFWLLASLLQIQTSEAFLLRGPVVTFAPNWSILKQPVELVQGQLTSDMAKATMWGWGIASRPFSLLSSSLEKGGSYAGNGVDSPLIQRHSRIPAHDTTGSRSWPGARGLYRTPPRPPRIHP